MWETTTKKPIFHDDLIRHDTIESDKEILWNCIKASPTTDGEHPPRPRFRELAIGHDRMLR